MGEPLADRPLTEPDRSRLSPTEPAYEEILDAHARAMGCGSMTYIDPSTGLLVLTAGYLATRGECCQSGCRHCPYVTSRFS